MHVYKTNNNNIVWCRNGDKRARVFSDFFLLGILNVSKKTSLLNAISRNNNENSLDLVADLKSRLANVDKAPS